MKSNGDDDQESNSNNLINQERSRNTKQSKRKQTLQQDSQI